MNAVAERAGARVLVVDDEPSIVDAISMTLRHQGYSVEAAENGKDALAMVTQWRPRRDRPRCDASRLDGFEVARRLSADNEPVPILFLSALDTTADKVRGLTIGGYDYVTKPFSLEELIARLRNILRRAGALRRRAAPAEVRRPRARRGHARGLRAGRPIELTGTEFRLLRYLMLNPRRVLTREQLLDHVWGYDFDGYPRVLETYISYLRKKIDAQGTPLLHTVRGVGYVAPAEGLSLLSLRARLLIGCRTGHAGPCGDGDRTYEEQRSFLFQRVDQQVGASAALVAGQLGVRSGGPRPVPPRRFGPVPRRRPTRSRHRGHTACCSRRSGKPAQARSIRLRRERGSPPALPASRAV